MGSALVLLRTSTMLGIGVLSTTDFCGGLGAGEVGDAALVAAGENDSRPVEATPYPIAPSSPY